MRHTYRDTLGRYARKPVKVPESLAAFYAFAATMGATLAAIALVCMGGR